MNEELIIMLDLETIKSSLSAELPIQVFEQISSTNAHLKQLGKNQPTVCISDQQTAGRGQRDKHWHSPAGVNLYLSLSMPFHQPVSALRGLSLAIGVMVTQALAPLIAPHEFKLKWPNDIYIDGKKCAGILIETQPTQESLQVIMGLGLNVNMQHSQQETIGKPWTSLKMVTNNSFDRNELSALLIQSLYEGFKLFSEQGFIAFQSAWNNLNLHQNQIVSFRHYQQEIKGTMLGVDEQGAMLIQDDKQQIKPYALAENLLLTGD